MDDIRKMLDAIAVDGIELESSWYDPGTKTLTVKAKTFAGENMLDDLLHEMSRRTPAIGWYWGKATALETAPLEMYLEA